MSVEKWKQSGCYVTTLLVVANVLVYAWMVFRTGELKMSGQTLYEYGAMISGPKHQGEWYRFVTAMFLHFDLEHLGNNMLMLLVIGSMLEKPMGSFSFAVVYFVGGLFGNVISELHYELANTNVIAAGASGAVFAVSGAFLFFELANRKRIGAAFSMPRLLIFAVLLLAQCVSQQGVDNYAHLGGLIAGFLLGAVLWLLIGRNRMAGLSWQLPESDREGNNMDYED